MSLGLQYAEFATAEVLERIKLHLVKKKTVSDNSFLSLSSCLLFR